MATRLKLTRLKIPISPNSLNCKKIAQKLHAYYKENEDQKRLTATDLDFDEWLAAFRAAQKEPNAA